MTNPIFGDFIAGAGAVYAEHGYEMLISVVPPDGIEAAYRDLASRRAVDGIIVHGPRMQDPRLPLLTEIGLPFVVHGRASGTETPYSWVDVNNRSAFRRATAFLTDLGHRRIGLINGPEDHDFAYRRRLGYEDALSARDLPISASWMFSDEMTERNGHAAAAEMLALREAPTAFVVASIISAIGVRRAVVDRGLRLGRDVSVVCFDDALSYMESGLDIPMFTAVRSCVREAGAKCARMVLQQIATPDGAPAELLMEADLIVGQSTGPAPT